MTKSDEKVLQYLDEAHAGEVALVSVLRSQIAMTPRGAYRDSLEKHLNETRRHAQRIEQRRRELGHGRDPVQTLVGIAETLISQTFALGKLPFDLLRGSGGEEKVLKNAKDAYSAEALEIATYTALERLATRVGDDQTAELAASILSEEERMRDRIMREIPKLSDAVVDAEIEGRPSYDITKTGAADAVRDAAREVDQSRARGAGERQAHRSAGAQDPGCRAGRGGDQGRNGLRGGSRHR